MSVTVNEERSVKLSVKWATLIQIVVGLLAIGGFTYGLRGDVERVKVGQKEMQESAKVMESRVTDLQRNAEIRLAELQTKIDLMSRQNERLEVKLDAVAKLLMENNRRSNGND